MEPDAKLSPMGERKPTRKAVGALVRFSVAGVTGKSQAVSVLDILAVEEGSATVEPSAFEPIVD
jgi:hypothetical protein